MEQNALILTALSVGFIHTLLGPDHYIPFLAISKARNWTLLKTLQITFLCGFGHVLGSIVLGGIGLLAGLALTSLETIESYRGDIAAWGLIAFGLIYMVIGIRRAYKNKPHKHLHYHNDGTVHSHEHVHKAAHSHIHDEKDKKNITPWVLFIIFAFGPCEVLIPMLMYPAAQDNYSLVVAVAVVFGLATIITMMAIVAISYLGLKTARMNLQWKYIHALAGAVVLLCGLSVKFLGI